MTKDVVWALVRSDPSLRSLARLVPLTIANALLYLGIYIQMVFRSGSLSPVIFGWILWSAAAIYLGFSKADRRCHDLALTLPLSARRLWLTHLLALAFGGGLILALSILLGRGLLGLIVSLSAFPEVRLDLPALVLHLGGVFALAVVLLQIGPPAAQRIPFNRRRLLVILAVLIGTSGLLGWLLTLPAYFSLLPLAAAAVIGARFYRALPEGFALAPDAPDHRQKEGFTDDGWSRAPSRLRGLGLALRTVLGDVKVWANLVMAVLVGWILGGGLDGFGDDLDILRYMYIPLVTYLLLAFSALIVRQLYIVDHLPISRRQVLALFVAPQVALLLLGYAGGTLSPDDEYVGMIYNRSEEHYFVVMPYRFWEIVPAESQTANTAPWGESQEAAQRPLFRGSAWALRSPVSTPPGSSMEFTSWQISRAVERVYGRQIPPQELAQRYLELNQKGEVVPKGGRLKLGNDELGLKPHPRGPLLPLLFALSVSPWLLILSVFLRAVRAGRSKRFQIGVLWAWLGLLMAALLGQFAASVMHLMDPEALLGWIEILMMRLGRSGVAVAALWALAGLLTLASYLVAQGQFERIEVTSELRPNCSWI